jgi:hypothetical protein
LVYALQINQSVGDILWVTNVIWRDFQFAASTLQDAIDQVAERTSVISLVFVKPLMSNCLRRFAGSEDVNWSLR